MRTGSSATFFFFLCQDIRAPDYDDVTADIFNRKQSPPYASAQCFAALSCASRQKASSKRDKTKDKAFISHFSVCIQSTTNTTQQLDTVYTPTFAGKTPKNKTATRSSKLNLPSPATHQNSNTMSGLKPGEVNLGVGATTLFFI